MKKYTDISTVTDEMLFEFIDRIEVHSVTGGRTRYRQQKIDVYFNFLGKYVPATEEISEEERIAMIDAEHEERLKAKNQRAAAKQKEYMAQLKIDAENGDSAAIKELAEYRKYMSEATTRSRKKMYEEAASGNLSAMERKENYLKGRRDSYRAKKESEMEFLKAE